MAAKKQFRITLKRSVIGCTESQRRTVRALGIRRTNHSVVLADNAANRGQILKVQHLLDVKPE